MNTLETLLDRFHSSILERDDTKIVPDMKRNPRINPEKQMAIYIEGYRLRLTGAIHSDYPVLLALLGDGEFNRLAGMFIESHPPMDVNLDRYPHAFAAFVREHVRDDFVADLAALEGAIAEVFMLPESPALSPNNIAAESFETMILKPRTASRLITFHYPVEDYRMQPTPARPETAPNYLYVVRHENEVKRHALEVSEYHALAKLFQGTPVGIALESAPEDRIQNWLGRWITNGFFTS